jgi:isochorismate synthase
MNLNHNTNFSTRETDLTKTAEFTHLRQTPQQHQLLAFYQAALAQELPVALWRYPHESHPQALVDFSGQAQPTKLNLKLNVPGFAFAPFLNRDGQATRFLKASLQLNASGLFLADDTLDVDETVNQIQFLSQFKTLTQQADHTWDWSLMPTTPEPITFANQADYCALVEQAIDYMQATEIKK